MKKARIFVRTLFSSAVLMLFLGTASCKNETKQEDPKEAAEDQNDAKFEENDNKEDNSQFLVDAAETDLMEIEIGKLAQSKGTSAHVKEFGKMLVDDHTKAANDTKALAEKLQVSLPAAITEKGKEHYNDLNEEKAGKDFDNKFADMMVKGHEDAISKMEDATEKTTNADIKAWAANMIPTLKMHLEHAKRLQDEVKK
jgi:putative membrane protein